MNRSILFVLIATWSCAALWASQEAQYATAQDACIAEAGTRAQADDCRCRVRQQYPTAPQCQPLLDGGWVLPTDPKDGGDQ